MMPRFPRLAIGAVVFALVMCVSVEVIGVSVSAATGAATTLKFDGATPTRTKGIVTLAAILTGADRKPLSKRPIKFYEQVDMLGPREALIGSVETDSTGTATLDYQPADNGEQMIIVRFAGDTSYAASEARGTIQVTGAVPIYAPAAEPLATPAWLLPRVLGLLIVFTWLVLFGVFITTTLGVRRMGRKATAGA